MGVCWLQLMKRLWDVFITAQPGAAVWWGGQAFVSEHAAKLGFQR